MSTRATRSSSGSSATAQSQSHHPATSSFANKGKRGRRDDSHRQDDHIDEEEQEHENNNSSSGGAKHARVATPARRYEDDQGANLPGRVFRKIADDMPSRCPVMDPRIGAAVAAATGGDADGEAEDDGIERFSVVKDWRKWDSLSAEQQAHIVKAVTRLFIFKAGRKESVDRADVTLCLDNLDPNNTRASNYRGHASVAIDKANEQLQKLFDLRIVGWNSVQGTKSEGFSNPVVGKFSVILFNVFWDIV
jgi:hypothetical protein